MTDNDIIKALEICNTSVEMESCVKCPYDAIVSKGFCSHEMINDAIKLINRQKADIERLENDIEEMADRLGVLLWHATDGMLSKSNYTTEVMVCALNDHIQRCCEEAEAEAIKEFAERLQKTITMLIAQELTGVGKEYDDIYFHTQHLGWINGSITARNEILTLIGNTAKEMVGERE